MYDYILLHHKLPGSFENAFLYQRDVQTACETRQSDKLYILGCKSNFAMRLPLIAFPKNMEKVVTHLFKLYLQIKIQKVHKSIVSTYLPVPGGTKFVKNWVLILF